MARDYEIEIVGAEHTERSLLSDEKKILAALFVASEEVERLLHESEVTYRDTLSQPPDRP